jgi:uncharacterized protein (TIGR00369 family)
MEKKRYALGDFFGENAQSLLDYTPHCREVSISAILIGPCEATLRIPFQKKLVGDPSRGVVFGGVITTLLDQAGGLAVLCSLEDFQSVATIDLRVDYMRPATSGCDLVGHARCYRLARHVAFVRGAAYHDDPGDPFATFLSTYMLGASLELPSFVGEVKGTEGIQESYRGT